MNSGMEKVDIAPGMCYSLPEIAIEMDVMTLKKGIYLCLLLALMCVWSGCSKNAAEAVPTETLTLQTTEVETELPTEAPTEEPTEPPTEPVEDRARELIRSGDYEGALELLETEPENEETEFLRLRARIGDVEVGKQVILGHFEQDDVSENGTEEIIWVAIAKEENRVFLLSLNCLDSRRYNDVKDGPVTWAESELRGWLNGEFCNSAFTETEQRLLTETELVTLDNEKYGTPGGENTVDRVFLLSMEEVDAYLDRGLRYGHVTAYADNRGAASNASDNGWWWLRSPGKVRRDACYVDALGKPSYYGYVVHRSGWSVRPAMWIDLSV